jgi:transcription antitermination factor NusG
MSVQDEVPTVTEPDRRAQHPWYVLRVQANREKTVASHLQCKGLTEFLPLYTTSRRWSDRTKLIQVPLFPGYVFCRFDADERLRILMTSHVLHVVGMGGIPAPVDEGELTALQRVVASGLLMQPWPFLKVGQRLVIQEGPLRNVEGVLTEIRGVRNLVVSITLLQRSVAVCIERSGVRPPSVASIASFRPTLHAERTRTTQVFKR